jgi:hypothetical protein
VDDLRRRGCTSSGSIGGENLFQSFRDAHLEFGAPFLG